MTQRSRRRRRLLAPLVLVVAVLAVAGLLTLAVTLVVGAVRDLPWAEVARGAAPASSPSATRPPTAPTTSRPPAPSPSSPSTAAPSTPPPTTAPPAPPTTAAPTAPPATRPAARPPGAPPALRPDGPGPLVGAGSGRCAGLEESGGSEGTRLELQDCDGSDAQLWTIRDDALVNRAGQRCLALVDRSGKQQAVEVSACSAGRGQEWELDEQGRVVNPSSDLCLSAAGGQAGAGTALSAFPCRDGRPNQAWVRP